MLNRKLKTNILKDRALKLEASLLCALLLSALWSVNSFSAQCGEIRGKMLRMHVIANSDSEADQSLKLKVRDAVLEEGREIFDGSVTADSAEEKITPQLSRLKETAERVIAEQGFEYKAEVLVCRDFFPTRTYEDSVTLPAGYYTAVKVVIGEGKGHNWWCVMFPPLCMPAAEADCKIEDVLTEGESDIVKNGEKYRIKFKVLEICERLFKN